MEPYDGSRNDAEFEAPPPRPRRLSMEDDFFYRELMTQRPARPPSYATAVKQPFPRAADGGAENDGSLSRGLAQQQQPEVLPNYTCDVHIEGVFMRKMEIEDTIKRAEYRNWHMVYVVLHGTALNIYQVKKDRAWWSVKTDGPNVSPDSPPWVRKAALEHSYSLLHADAGIAADYRKRRYVIRVRAEADQFLLSCVELRTFVNWLDNIFAAIVVAAPIDERDFPRDQSIPRVQRIRWLRGQLSRPGDNATGFQRLDARRPSIASIASSDRNFAGDIAAGPASVLGDEQPIEEEEAEATEAPAAGPSRAEQHPAVGRLSTTSYPNEAIDADTGKWSPRQAWTEMHDHLYAKLCFSVLLFKSPRKSNYVVAKGKQWFVDWASGRMIRVLPPAYGEEDTFRPWQVVMPENRLI